MSKCASFVELEREDAEKAGFATFNDCRHVCLDLPQSTITISVRTPDGNKTTFSFVRRPNGERGHQCVDILHHCNDKGDHHPQEMIGFGAGAKTFVVTKDDDNLTYLTTLLLKK